MFFDRMFFFLFFSSTHFKRGGALAPPMDEPPLPLTHPLFHVEMAESSVGLRAVLRGSATRQLLPAGRLFHRRRGPLHLLHLPLLRLLRLHQRPASPRVPPFGGLRHQRGRRQFLLPIILLLLHIFLLLLFILLLQHGLLHVQLLRQLDTD